MKQEKVKRTACYCRVSTDEQAKHGYSIGAQREALESYCKANKLDCVGFFVDEGISARKSYKKRPALLRLLSLVEQDKIDLIIFIKLDRWFRNVAAYYQVQPILEAHNVAWAATQEDYETITASGRFKVNIMLSVAQDESDRTSERVHFVFSSKRAKGEALGGRVPFGFKVEDKKLVIDPSTAPIAKDIFDSFLEMRSTEKVREMLKERYGLERERRGINHLLSNPKYVQFGLIDPDTFAKVQEAAKSRAPKYVHDSEHSRNTVYLFSGLCYCGTCGHRLRSTIVKGNYYLNCPECHKYFQEKDLESYVVSEMRNIIGDYNVNIDRLKKEKAEKQKGDCPEELEKQKQKLLDLYMSDLIDRDTYQKRFNDLTERIEKAKAETKAAESLKPIDGEKIMQVMDLYATFDREKRKKVYNHFFSRIIVNQKDDYEIYFL